LGDDRNVFLGEELMFACCSNCDIALNDQHSRLTQTEQ
jgi:hypothetical protein